MWRQSVRSLEGDEIRADPEPECAGAEIKLLIRKNGLYHSLASLYNKVFKSNSIELSTTTASNVLGCPTNSEALDALHKLPKREARSCEGRMPSHALLQPVSLLHLTLILPPQSWISESSEKRFTTTMHRAAQREVQVRLSRRLLGMTHDHGSQSLGVNIPMHKNEESDHFWSPRGIFVIQTNNWISDCHHSSSQSRRQANHENCA